MQAAEREIPVFNGPESVRPGKFGRTIEYEWEEENRRAYVPFPLAYRRKYRPLLSPSNHDHILTDDEIDRLLSAINHGYDANKFESTDEFLSFLTLREKVVLEEKTYGMYESDVSVVRFFEDSNRGDKKENILADIKRLNQEQGMGNVKIPGTSIEIINYSPCPKCGHVHSFSDVFNYYQNPTPDPTYKSRRLQYQLDTRVMCVECKVFFLPALIISDGTPRNEHQMICRSQTIREVCVFMRETTRIDVLWMKNENILDDVRDDGTAVRAWRNDVDAKVLKKRPGLFSNMLQYTPANLMLDFISRKNLEKEEPLFGAWVPKQHIQSPYSW